MRHLAGATAGALGLAIGAQVVVPLGEVPMTLQTLALCLTGLLGGGRVAALAALLYLGAVVAGLPVLAGGVGAGGLDFLSLKSAGYVVGFVPAAWGIGQVAGRRWWLGLLACLGGHGVVLLLGVAVLAGHLGVAAALEHGLWPFLPGAVVKSVAAVGLVEAWSATRR